MKNLIILFAITSLLALNAAAGTKENSMIGNWEGSSQVIVTWCEQKKLPVSLTILADGSVNGTVGDAELLDGQLERKVNWFGSNTKNRTTHLVKGRLKGAIVAKEGVFRERAFIHLRVDHTNLSGSLATSGSKMGGKESMILTAQHLILSKKL